MPALLPIWAFEYPLPSYSQGACPPALFSRTLSSRKIKKQSAIELPKTSILPLYGIACIAVIVCGIFLRIENAQARILHSDEAVQAYQLWELMETGEYRYDPEDKHGPLLYYFASALNKGLGIESAELGRVSLRLLPILASVGLMIFLLTLLREASLTTMLGGAFVALSPLPVIYGAYFVQEALFVLIGFFLLYSYFTFWNGQTVVRAAIVGLWTGVFFVTKETAIINIAAIALTVFIAFPPGRRLESWQKAARLPNLAAGLGSFVLIWGLFYSSGFKDFSQLGDSFRAFINYAERSQGAGHEKPFFYYLSIMWPHTAEGVRWGESLFLLLSFAGLIVTFVDRRSLDPRLQLGIFYGFLCLLLYSTIPYKTPWLALSSYASLALAAGLAIRFLYGRYSNGWIRVIVIGVSLYCLFGQYELTKLASRYAADARNPYIYQHTSPQFQKLVDRIADLEALDPEGQLTIAVGGDDNAWPLPWYLRDNDTVGYWMDPRQTPPLDVVLGRAGELPPTLSATHTPEYHGLRENVLLECWIKNELWDAFMETR